MQRGCELAGQAPVSRGPKEVDTPIRLTVRAEGEARAPSAADKVAGANVLIASALRLFKQERGENNHGRYGR